MITPSLRVMLQYGNCRRRVFVKCLPLCVLFSKLTKRTDAIVLLRCKLCFRRRVTRRWWKQRAKISTNNSICSIVQGDIDDVLTHMLVSKKIIFWHLFDT